MTSPSSFPAPHSRYALVLDDHPLVARGMCEFLRQLPCLEDAAFAGTTDEALRTIAACGQPALTLLDFWLAEGSTTHCVRDLLALAPQTRVLMVSGDNHPGIPLKARSCGAHGFIHKQRCPEVFAQAATAVLQGGTWFDEAAGTPPHVQQLRELPLSPAELGLTPRQGQILAQLLEGRPNKHIAATLNLSEHTVKEHVTALLGKLGARNRVEAIARLRGVRLEVPEAASAHS